MVKVDELKKHSVQDQVTKVEAFFKYPHDDKLHRKSSGVYFTPTAMEKIQSKLGVTEMTIDAQALVLDALNKQYGIELTAFDFNRSLTAERPIMVASDGSTDKVATFVEFMQKKKLTTAEEVIKILFANKKAYKMSNKQIESAIPTIKLAEQQLNGLDSDLINLISKL